MHLANGWTDWRGTTGHERKAAFFSSFLAGGAGPWALQVPTRSRAQLCPRPRARPPAAHGFRGPMLAALTDINLQTPGAASPYAALIN